MMNTQKEDVKTFQNPFGAWKHDGAFSVELTDDADMSIAPSSTRIIGQTVHVDYGYVTQSMGGIQLSSKGNQFFWGYRFIKVIRDSSGNLLWVNSNQQRS